MVGRRIGAILLAAAVCGCAGSATGSPVAPPTEPPVASRSPAPSLSSASASPVVMPTPTATPVPAPTTPAGATAARTPSERRPDGAVLRYRPGGSGSAQNPALSPDGATLLFTIFHRGYNEGPAGLFTMPVTGGQPAALLDQPDRDAVDLPGSCWNAATGRIAFSSDRAGTDEVWTMTAAGKDLRRLTSKVAGGPSIEPSFSPDGRWVVFEADNGAAEESARGSIFKVSADGTGLTRLTAGPGGGFDDRQPNWSPRGDRIVFQRRAAGSDDWNLYSMAADGGDLRRLTTTASDDTDASWSPDGRRIVFSSNYGGLPSANLFTVSADGGTPIRLTNSPTTEDGAAAWSPDGRTIFFESHLAASETSPAAIWSIEVDRPLD